MSEEMKPVEPEVNDGRPWIAVFLNEDSTIKVTGHINNKLMSYGLLECAKDSIRQHIERQAKIERVNKSGGLIHSIRNGLHL